MSIFIIICTILMIIYYIKNPTPNRLTLKQRVAQKNQEQEDRKQRAIDRMPKFGYYIYHIAPKDTPLNEGFVGMTNTLEKLKDYMFNSLKQGTYNNKILQKAWDDNEFTQDDFHILFKDLSGRKACEKTVELRGYDYIGWNEAMGGWAWNDAQFRE